MVKLTHHCRQQTEDNPGHSGGFACEQGANQGSSQCILILLPSKDFDVIDLPRLQLPLILFEPIDSAMKVADTHHERTFRSVASNPFSPLAAAL